MAELIDILSLGDMCKALQDLGFRAEIGTAPDGNPMISSASGGVNFNLRPGNRNDDGFVDFSLFVAFRVEPKLAEVAVAEWNKGRRFGRLYAPEGLVVLEMDVIVAGGVTPKFLRGNLEIWNRLLNELLTYLRDTGQRLDVLARAAA